MKRFLSLLTVFVLAFSLAIPVGATSDDLVSYNGYSLVDIETVWASNKAKYPIAVIGIRNDKICLEILRGNYAIDDSTGELVGLPDHGFTRYYYDESGYWSFYKEVYNNNSEESHSLVPFWSTVTLYYRDSGEVAIFGSLTCDGSSCPATDVSIDGICDDCGMTLMSLSRTPVPPDVVGSNKNTVLFYSGTVYQYTAYTSDSSYTIRGEEYGARYRTYLEPSVNAVRYQSYDGINWEETYNGKTANDYPGEIGWELISSTYDWYTEEGDRFFPVPLWEEVEKVTQGEMSNLTMETAGTMKTLVVCGVGLMALLMALSLFGKRWLLFLR